MSQIEVLDNVSLREGGQHARSQTDGLKTSVSIERISREPRSGVSAHRQAWIANQRYRLTKVSRFPYQLTFRRERPLQIDRSAVERRTKVVVEYPSPSTIAVPEVIGQAL